MSISELERENAELKAANAALKRENANLKAAKLELNDQVKLMETIFDSLSEGVVATDLAGEFLVANPSAQEMVGMAPVEGAPEEWSETYGTFYPDKTTLVPSTELPLYKAMQGETTDDVKLVLRNQNRPDGVFVSIGGRPLHDETGALVGGVIAMRDATQLEQVTKQLEATVQDLQAQNNLMDAIFNSISDGVIVADQDGKYVLFNKTARSIVGQDIENVHIRQAPEKLGLFRPESEEFYPVDELPLARAVKGEYADNVEILIRNPQVPDGVHTSISGRPIYDEKGVVNGAVAAIRDISTLKKTEEHLKITSYQLEVQNQLLQSVFDSMGDGVLVADKTGRIIMVNPGARQINGMVELFTEQEAWVRGYNYFYSDAVTPYPLDELPMSLAIKGESVDNVEMFINNDEFPDGAHLNVSGRPLLDADGELNGGVIIFRDVTERVKTEEALAQAFAQGRLEIVDTILHNIGNAINSVSVGIETIHHQIKNDKLTPRLTALAKALEENKENFSDYIKNDPQGQKVLPFILTLAADFNIVKYQWEETVERIRNRTGHIVDIIRMQNTYHGASTTRKDINLEAAILDAIRILQESIDKRQIQIKVDCDNAPEDIRIQESQFHQMLVNIIKNSVEAVDELAQLGERNNNEAPRIEIRSHIQDNSLNIDITDNGIGIEPQDLEKIFSAGFTSKEHGSGLGLHSSANFVIGSGGEIQACSDGIGTGATIRIILRLSSIQRNDRERNE